MTVQEKLLRAFESQKAGQLRQAAEGYRDILRVDASHPDALHLLGLIESNQGNHQQAVALVRQAVEVAPANPTILSNFGVVLRHAGQITDAIEAYRRSLALDPANADAHFNLGKSLKLSGDRAQAEVSFRTAISLAPQKAAAWLSLIALYSDRDPVAALSIATQALGFCPNNADLWMNLGALHRKAGRIEEAVTHYRRAVELSPRKVDALSRLASTLISKQDIEEGQKFLALAQAIEPESVHVLNSLGLLHNTLGNSTAAIQVYRRAIELHPSYGTAHSNLSSALRKLGLVSESLECVRRGIELEPDNIESKVIEGGALMLLGELQGAEASFVAAINAKGGYRDAHDSLLMCRHYQPEYTAADNLLAHREWDNRYGQALLNSRSFSLEQTTNRPLRVGFVSADLGAHPVGYFTLRMFEALDSQELETYVYSDRIGEDPVSQRIAKAVDHWSLTAALGDDALYQKIVSDKIDILFDLAGHTAHNRLLVFARRAAPVQITWAGYVGTTGLSTMDYLLADRHHVPPQADEFYTENVLRMPESYITYCPPDDVPQVGPLPAIRNGFVTFAAMCNPAKVNSEVLELWSKILRSAPGSRLLLSYSGWPDPASRQRVLLGLGDSISHDRIDFDYQVGPAGLMSLYNEVDIALDTFPYSGGLTTLEALWMGVPTVTWPGERFAGRHSLSHMSTVGLSDWVCSDKSSYVDTALDKASDLQNLAQLRKGLRNQVEASPLCDGISFARHFTQLMKQTLAKIHTSGRLA